MKKEALLRCNVCKERPKVRVTEYPRHSGDGVFCPSCSKTLMYATESDYSNKLTWNAMDTDYNKDFGGTPVTVIYNNFES